MTLTQNRSLFAVSLIALALSGILVILGGYRRHLELKVAAGQAEVAALQEELNRGNMSQRLAANIVQDLAPLAGRPDVQTLLARYGITVNRNAPPSNP